MFYALFDDKRDIDIDKDIYLLQRPNIPPPERAYRVTNVEGKGDVYEDLGYYNDIEIPLEYNFYSEKYNETYRRIKKFFKRGEKLKFSDDGEGFYKIKKITIANNLREMIEFGKFTVLVICEPYFYFDYGENEIELKNENIFFNDDEETIPIFRITGNGLFILKMNGNTFKVNVGQEVLIDVSKGRCYRKDGAISDSSVSGKYKELRLLEGENTISFNVGFKVGMIPNWRCL